MPDYSQLQPGDVIGFSSCGCTGLVINVSTWGVPFWDLSHVGLVAGDPLGRTVMHWERNEEGKRVTVERPMMLIWESTSLVKLRCAVSGQVVSGVQAHRPRDRIPTYRGRVWRYPLAEPLADWQAELLTKWCERHLGREYDALEAIGARDLPLAWLHRKLFGKEDLRRLYCAEFDAAAERYIGRFQTDYAGRWNPNSLCRELLRRGIVQRPIRLK